MPTILIAPDKFKNSLSAIEFCNICRDYLLSYNSNLHIKLFPLADGGDGTVEIIKYYIHGKLIKLKVSDPLDRIVEASYIYNQSTHTAYIEKGAKHNGKRIRKRTENK